jgi:hypothetical protein
MQVFKTSASRLNGFGRTLPLLEVTPPTSFLLVNLQGLQVSRTASTLTLRFSDQRCHLDERTTPAHEPENVRSHLRLPYNRARRLPSRSKYHKLLFKEEITTRN